MLKHPRFRKYEIDHKGLSLLEVLAALALLVLGITAIFGGFGNATRWNQEAYLSTQAISFAAAIIENYKARPDQIRVMPETAVSDLDLDLEVPPGVEATVTIDEYDQILDLYRVVVRVNWSIRGYSRSEVLGCIWPGSGL